VGSLKELRSAEFRVRDAEFELQWHGAAATPLLEIRSKDGFRLSLSVNKYYEPHVERCVS
jgi:hypothetical protein